ncbi:peptidyl-prolyl cis-trans isomerase [Lederbergia sp. NSJ-179]|uniref:peptidyl-prolyl cis-trans isomerase n=1 Tax=Lederbergia sp. NSJ-179 TaxID=2931402 RepID=UPI001FD4BBF8|nr:peptidyl-prolyl cis-trans isomerase [Lederbergia sp. NSJ-179]MCJ7843267.1 peptidyl-prolyl cis-trans isomerase [Lederbergia sp. NSJ-179]
MNMIMTIKGKVKFPITLDVGAWIFDDRRIDLDTYFSKEEKQEAAKEEATTASKHWDRSIKEGAVPPRKPPKRYEKAKMLTSTFGIKLEPFLKNAEPDPDATLLIFETNAEEVSIPLEDGYKIIVQFSNKGKPLKEDGPVHILLPEATNFDHPIKNVKAFRVE